MDSQNDERQHTKVFYQIYEKYDKTKDVDTVLDRISEDVRSTTANDLLRSKFLECRKVCMEKCIPILHTFEYRVGKSCKILHPDDEV